MDDVELILEAREINQAALEDTVRAIFNCAEAEVDGDGDIWIRGPMSPHWLSQDELAKVAQTLRGCDI